MKRGRDRYTHSTSHAYLYKIFVEKLKYTYTNNYDNHPRRAKRSNFFIRATDGHVAFTTLLHLDANFAIAPRALHLGNLAAPDAPLVIPTRAVQYSL